MKNRDNKTKRFLENNRRRKFDKKVKRKNKKYTPYKNRSVKHIKNAKPPFELSELGYDLSRDINVSEKTPDVFSVTENPNETIAFLKRISSLFLNKQDLDLNITCSNLQKIDISALLLLCIIVNRGCFYLRKSHYNCKISGDYPKNRELKKEFAHSGLPKYLNIVNFDDASIEVLNPFNSVKRIDDESQRIINYYDKCLKRNGYKLSEVGEAYFHKLTNEIIENALIHSGHAILYSGGYYDHENKKGQISIISFGNTMYETIYGESSSTEMKEKIQTHLNNQKNLFDLYYNEESSCTVFALQDKVSRYSNSKHLDRGTGTVKFIEAFMDMSSKVNGEKPKTSILSGKTRVLFDGKYKLKDEIINGTSVRIIAFNESNSLNEKPDKKYVESLSNKFPGVIINIEFVMNDSYLQKLTGGK